MHYQVFIYGCVHIFIYRSLQKWNTWVKTDGNITERRFWYERIKLNYSKGAVTPCWLNFNLNHNSRCMTKKSQEKLNNKPNILQFTFSESIFNETNCYWAFCIIQSERNRCFTFKTKLKENIDNSCYSSIHQWSISLLCIQNKYEIHLLQAKFYKLITVSLGLTSRTADSDSLKLRGISCFRTFLYSCRVTCEI